MKKGPKNPRQKGHVPAGLDLKSAEFPSFEAADLPDLTSESLAKAFAEPEKKDAALPPAWQAVGVPKQISHARRAAKREFYDFSQVQAAVDLLRRLPGPEETIHAIMNSLFKGVDLVPAVIRLAGEPCRELIVTTLGFNRQDAACLCELMTKGDVHRLAMVCSNFFAEKDLGAYRYAQARFAEVGGRIAVSRNHSKILLFDFARAGLFAVESSANLRSCYNLEQFCLTQSPALHAFHRGWISRMFETPKA